MATISRYATPPSVNISSPSVRARRQTDSKSKSRKSQIKFSPRNRDAAMGLRAWSGRTISPCCSGRRWLKSVCNTPRSALGPVEHFHTPRASSLLHAETVSPRELHGRRSPTPASVWSICLALRWVASVVRVSGALCCSIVSGLDWPSEVLNSIVDRVPSTRELNFIVIATSGPCTVCIDRRRGLDQHRMSRGHTRNQHHYRRHSDRHADAKRTSSDRTAK